MSTIEKWKPIIGHETYKVSNMGRIKNSRNMIMSVNTLRSGYPCICLDKKTESVHIAVATAYVSNPKPGIFNQVNHIDLDKMNNKATNLEWIDSRGNNIHAAKHRKHNTIRVHQCDMDGNIIKTFDSIIEAAKETGASENHIPSVCTGKRNSSGGYKWKYAIETKLEVLPKGKKVKDFPNYIVCKDGKIFSIISNRELTGSLTAGGYKKVTLSKKSKTKTMLIHIIVARAYLIPQDNQTEVNHKNAIKTDNRLINLEWVTPVENMNHASKHIKYHTVAVAQYKMNGKTLIATFKSISDAATSTGIDNSSIVKSCKGKVLHAGNFIWKYLNPKEYINEE